MMIDEVCGGMLGTHLIIDSKTNEEEAICVYGDGVILLVLARLKVVVQGRHVQTAVHARRAGQVLHHLWWRLPRDGGLGTVDELKYKSN